MKFIIDIPDGYVEKALSGKYNLASFCDLAIRKALINGTPLPKGHGRLIDADELKVELECGIRAGNYEEGYEKYAHINNMDDCVDAVKYADTIIEADKEESESDKE